MALTKAQLKEILSAAGVSTENVESAVAKIMDGHLMSVNALREERDTYKADAERLPAVQKELDELKKSGSPDDWKKKFDDEHAAFEDFKAKISGEQERAKKVELYRKLLSDSKVDEKRLDAIIKVTDLDKLKVSKDGKLEGEEDLVKSIKDEWSSFIIEKKQKGANTDNPPENNGGGNGNGSRARELAAKYHESLYGKMKEG